METIKRNKPMKKETLVEKAKKISVGVSNKIPMTDEHIDLALSWMKGEIRLTQLAGVVGITKGEYTGNLLYRIAQWLREAYRQGKLEIK